MDLTRIAGAIDVERTAAAHVAVFGAGGSAGLVCNLARCGVRRFTLFDFDSVTLSNVARQHHDATDIGRAKVASLSGAIRRINPDALIEEVKANFLEMEADRLREHLATCDLMIFATDRFEAQARGNELALQTGVPAMWIGLYEDAGAGEIVFWHHEIDACFRCLCGKRYEAHEFAVIEQRSIDPVSDGCTIFDVTLLDAVAGMIAVGLLTRGSDNRFGRLVSELGDRNFIQIQLAHDWDLGGINPVRKYLEIRETCAAFYAWNAIVRSDPDRGRMPCIDCIHFRGHEFILVDGRPVRIRA